MFVLLDLVGHDALHDFKYFGVYLFGMLLDSFLIVINRGREEYLVHIGRGGLRVRAAIS